MAENVDTTKKEDEKMEEVKKTANELDEPVKMEVAKGLDEAQILPATKDSKVLEKQEAEPEKEGKAEEEEAKKAEESA